MAEITPELWARARGGIRADLKPCPFCGRHPSASSRHRSESDAEHDEGRGFIAFRACYGGGYSAHAHFVGTGKTFEEADAAADAAWNTRFEST
jgi:hypothetical protein